MDYFIKIDSRYFVFAALFSEATIYSGGTSPCPGGLIKCFIFLMANHNITGKREALALAYLVRNHFVILHTNWRYAHCEIDIIAHIGDVLHFIGVKTSTPAVWMSRKRYKEKDENLLTGSEAFLSQSSMERVQYDILSIQLRKDSDPEYFYGRCLPVLAWRHFQPFIGCRRRLFFLCTHVVCHLLVRCGNRHNQGRTA